MLCVPQDSPGVRSSHEASTALRGGPHGLAVHQRGDWDLAVQHSVYPSAGSTSTLQWRSHPLGHCCLWVHVDTLGSSHRWTPWKCDYVLLNTGYSCRLLHSISTLHSGPIQSVHSRSRPSPCGPPHTSLRCGYRRVHFFTADWLYLTAASKPNVDLLVVLLFCHRARALGVVQ